MRGCRSYRKVVKLVGLKEAWPEQQLRRREIGEGVERVVVVCSAQRLKSSQVKSSRGESVYAGSKWTWRQPREFTWMSGEMAGRLFDGRQFPTMMFQMEG